MMCHNSREQNNMMYTETTMSTNKTCCIRAEVFLIDISFKKNPKHAVYVPRFEADFAQFCEKLVNCLSFSSSSIAFIFFYFIMKYKPYLLFYFI